MGTDSEDCVPVCSTLTDKSKRKNMTRIKGLQDFRNRRRKKC